MIAYYESRAEKAPAALLPQMANALSASADELLDTFIEREELKELKCLPCKSNSVSPCASLTATPPAAKD